MKVGNLVKFSSENRDETVFILSEPKSDGSIEVNFVKNGANKPNCHVVISYGMIYSNNWQQSVVISDKSTAIQEKELMEWLNENKGDNAIPDEVVIY